MEQRATNDFTIRVATVNGSGSQSSNLVLTSAIFRMGIPVAPKNVFPSNIEGLPTWFDVRVTSKGYQCRARDFDVLVALNASTWPTDVAGVRSGGVVVHEAAYPVAGATRRKDLTYYAVPFAELAKKHVAQGDLRKYLTNMIYVGAVAELLGIDVETLEAAVTAQFKSKPAAVQTNMAAVRLGVEYAREHFKKSDAFRLEPMSGVTDGLMFMDGNRAAALGCVMGGCTFAAWYPITPSSSLCESFIQLCDRYRTDAKTGERRAAIVQAEDELAAIGMVLGAGWAGARSMTATSGPGISLMAEFSGLGYYAEIPGVIFDVQRTGPSTGMPTRTSQADLLSVAFLSHGDTKHVVLLPGNMRECFELGYAAFDLAERLQTPVFVLSDLDLGMNNWMSDPFDYPTTPQDRGKVLTKDDLDRLGGFARYRDVDGDAIGWRTLPGTDHPKAAYFTRGSGHNDAAGYTERPDEYVEVMDRLARKFENARKLVPGPVTVKDGSSKIGFLAYGSTDFALRESMDQIKKEYGQDVDYMRIRAYPFAHEIHDFVASHERVYVVEQDREAQLASLLKLDIPAEHVTRLRSILHYNGLPLDARTITEEFATKEGL